MKASIRCAIRAASVSSILVCALVLIACQQTQPTSSGAATTPPPATEKVFVVFEGPWAVAPDPKDSGKVLLIAPKTKDHQDLYVAASNDKTLGSGVYELSIPISGSPSATTTAADFAQAKTTAADLQHALDAKSGRYVIRLPKPEAFLAASRFTSRVGPSYPPDNSTEREYVTAVSLRYSVSSANGFSLSGTPDTGSFNPVLFKVEANNLQFDIRPTKADPADKCYVHARQAFHDLTRLLNVSLFIDFPDSPISCRDTDPQRAKGSARNIEPSTSEPLQYEAATGVQEASVLPGIPRIFPFFAYKPLFCTGAVIMLTVS